MIPYRRCRFHPRDTSRLTLPPAVEEGAEGAEGEGRGEEGEREDGAGDGGEREGGERDGRGEESPEVMAGVVEPNVGPVSACRQWRVLAMLHV
jgi:hypothetical protein